MKRISNLFEIQSFCNNNESDNARNYGNLRKKYLNDKLESYMAHWRSPEIYWLKLNMHIMAYKRENKSYETWAWNSARSSIIKREKQKVETCYTAFNEDLIINYGSLEIQFVSVSKRTSIIVKRLFDQIIGFWLYFKNIEFSNYIPATILSSKFFFHQSKIVIRNFFKNEN